MKLLFRYWLVALVVLCSVVLCSADARGERPAAPLLLPETTLAVVRVADTPKLVDRFRETALGRMGHDEKIKPLVSQLYAAVQQAFRQVEDRVGLPLDQLLQIPQGEICVAFAALPEKDPGIIAIIDVKERMFQAKKLLAKGEELAFRNGGARTTEKIAGQEVAMYNGLGPTPIFLFEREGALIFASKRDLIEFVITNCDGPVNRTLADNGNFSAIMNRCGVGTDDPPQIAVYVNPIETIRRLATGNFAATGLALFPVLGLDGLLGAGGSITYASGDFDQITHLHVLLDNPRAGVIDAVALKSGDSTPENWVPDDCISYSTIHWDLAHTLRVSSKLYNSLMGEGALEKELQARVGQPLGIDFEREVLPHLSGRGTHVQWVQRPVTFDSIKTLVGLHLRDPQAFKPVLEKIVQKYAERAEKQRFGNVSFWSFKTPEQPQVQVQQQPGGRETRVQRNFALKCVGIVGDTLLASDSLKAFQEAVAAQTNTDHSLATSLDFKLIASKISRQPGGGAPAAVQFSRPEEGMRFWYDMALSENTQKRLAQQAASSGFFRSVDQALKDNPLPPFEVLAQYLAPGGGMLVNDETGIHYSSFTLKRK